MKAKRHDVLARDVQAGDQVLWLGRWRYVHEVRPAGASLTLLLSGLGGVEVRGDRTMSAMDRPPQRPQ